MALLEYATLTVPDVVQKGVLSFYNRDPLMKRVKERNGIKRSGGTEVRIIRTISGHSDVVQIDESNMSVPLNKKPTLATLTGDWARYIKPIILPHFDQNRMQSKDEKKRFVQAHTMAAVQSLKNDFARRIYVSNVTKLRGLGSLNGAGSATTGTSSGFTKGALYFDTPTAQASANITYLNETRQVDTTNYQNNWYNQYKAHNGIGTDFLPTAEEIKITADTFAEDEEGISLGILGTTNHVALADEVRAYPGGGASALRYSVQDIEDGKAHPTVYIANGVQYYPNRWMTDSDMGKTEPCYFLNPNNVQWWVNAGCDFKVTPFKDGLDGGNQDGDIAYIICEVQFCLDNLLVHGCTDNP